MTVTRVSGWRMSDHSATSGAPSAAVTRTWTGCFATGAAGSSRRLHRAVKRGIVRAPDQIARADARELNRAVAETQFQAAVETGQHLVDAAALFGLLRAAPVGRVEDHSVARL